VVCLVFGFLFGVPALRLQGIYLALATFSLAVATPQILKFTPLEHWTGGVQGIVIIKPDAPFGLPLSPDQLPAVDDGAILLEPSHGLSGNPSRFRSGVVRLRPDQAWATQMPAGARAVVTGLTLPLLLDYGYTGHRSPHAASAALVGAPAPTRRTTT